MICKRFKKFETCPSVSNILCGKPVSLIQILFDDNFKLFPTQFGVLDISSTSCKPDNFMGAISRVCGLQPGPKFEVRPAAEKNSLPEKTYFRGPAISWKSQKDQVNFTFTSAFWLKKDDISHHGKVQNKNFSVTSKYHLSIIFLPQEKTMFPIPKISKQELFSSQ